MVDRLGRTLAVLLFVLLGGACSSLKFKTVGPGYGTFTSTATSFTLLSTDYPGPAVLVARANVTDSRQPNLLVEKEIVFPYLWRLDWILDILMIRHARVQGTWGVWPEEGAAEASTSGSTPGS